METQRMLAHVGPWTLDVGLKYGKLRQHSPFQQAQDLSHSI
jgi:hypothetical protein